MRTVVIYLAVFSNIEEDKVELVLIYIDTSFIFIFIYR